MHALDRNDDPRGGVQSEEYRHAAPVEIVEDAGVAMGGPGGAVPGRPDAGRAARARPRLARRDRQPRRNCDGGKAAAAPSTVHARPLPSDESAVTSTRVAAASPASTSSATARAARAGARAWRRRAVAPRATRSRAHCRAAAPLRRAARLRRADDGRRRGRRRSTPTRAATPSRAGRPGRARARARASIRRRRRGTASPARSSAQGGTTRRARRRRPCRRAR